MKKNGLLSSGINTIGISETLNFHCKAIKLRNKYSNANTFWRGGLVELLYLHCAGGNKTYDKYLGIPMSYELQSYKDVHILFQEPHYWNLY